MAPPFTPEKTLVFDEGDFISGWASLGSLPESWQHRRRHLFHPKALQVGQKLFVLESDGNEGDALSSWAFGYFRGSTCYHVGRKTVGRSENLDKLLVDSVVTFMKDKGLLAANAQVREE